MAVLMFKDSNGNIRRVPNVRIKSEFDDKVFVRVKDAILSSREDSSINGKTRALVRLGTYIIATAVEFPDMFFNYFVDEDNKIVTYGNKHETRLRSDKIFRAVYSEQEIEPQPLIYISNVEEVYSDEKAGYIRFNMHTRIPNTYEKLEWGVLISPKFSTPEELVVDGDPKWVEKHFINEPYATARNADVWYTWSGNIAWFFDYEQYYIRTFARIEKDGVEEIIYSDIVKVFV